MKNSMRALVIGSIIMLTTLIVGVLGYCLAGWSIIDAIFMVIITVFGVGYGEIHPEGPLLRIFTMCIILAGCTSLIYLIGGFIQSITEGEIQKAFGRRRMQADIDKLTDHAIICGYGRIGRIISEQLTNAGRPFVVIEKDTEKLGEAGTRPLNYIQGDATEEVTLNLAGVSRASVLATVLPNDAANVFITLSARNLNTSLKIIARGEQPSTEDKLFQAGANRVVLPAQIGAQRIADQIIHPTTEDLLQNNRALQQLDSDLGDLGIHVREYKVESDSPLVGRSLGQIESQGAAPFLMVALHKADGRDIVQPKPDTVIQAGDSLIYVAHQDNPLELLAGKPSRIRYRGAKA